MYVFNSGFGQALNLTSTQLPLSRLAPVNTVRAVVPTAPTPGVTAAPVLPALPGKPVVPIYGITGTAQLTLPSALIKLASSPQISPASAAAMLAAAKAAAAVPAVTPFGAGAKWTETAFAAACVNQLQGKVAAPGVCLLADGAKVGPGTDASSIACLNAVGVCAGVAPAAAAAAAPAAGNAVLLGAAALAALLLLR